MTDRTIPRQPPMAEVLAAVDKAASNHGAQDHQDEQRPEFPPRRPQPMAATAKAGYAPPTAPERIEQIAKASGDAIRASCDTTGKSIMALVVEAEQQVNAARQDAEAFIKQLERIGNAHGERMSMIINGIGSITQTIATERKKIAEIANFKVEVDVDA